jgi:hypothetical protein
VEFGPNQRLLAAALADRLIYGAEETFQAEDAVELRALLPAPTRWDRLRALFPQMSARGEIKGGSRRGMAAGVGSVELKEDHRSFEFDTQGRRTFRAGQWKLTLEEPLLSWRGPTACLSITQVMGEAMDELEARLHFQGDEPRTMERSVVLSVPLGAVIVSRVVFRKWKRPIPQARESFPDASGSEQGVSQA